MSAPLGSATAPCPSLIAQLTRLEVSKQHLYIACARSRVQTLYTRVPARQRANFHRPLRSRHHPREARWTRVNRQECRIPPARPSRQPRPSPSCVSVSLDHSAPPPPGLCRDHAALADMRARRCGGDGSQGALEADAQHSLAVVGHRKIRNHRLWRQGHPRRRRVMTALLTDRHSMDSRD